MATSKTRTRKAKTAADLKADLEKMKQRIAAAEAKEYGGAVEAMVKELNLASSFNVIKSNVPGATDILILETLCKAAGVKRIKITQAEPKERAKKGAAK